MQRSWCISSIEHFDFDAGILRGSLGILNENVEIFTLVENTRINEFIFGIKWGSSPIFFFEFLIRKFLLRIFVEVFHVGMGRCRIEVVITFLDIFAMVAFPSIQSKQPLF